MIRDCCDCCQWDQANEVCTAWELLEYDPEEFDKLCPKINGDPEFEGEDND